LHFYDPAPGPDGKPSTDLTIGLTDRPHWAGGNSGLGTEADENRQNGEAGGTVGTPIFLPNIPTEELFTTPHRLRVNGWMRTSRPSFPFRREVDEVTFRFEDGCVVDFSAGEGQETYEQFFAVEGTRYLGEVALVDVSSPIFQSGLTYYNTLFDENAACHVAFGQAYPIGLEGGAELSAEEQFEAGVNSSDLHLDVMIGTATLDVTGHLSDGSELEIMRQGRYTSAVLA
jgi:aminopeptidase